MKGYCVTTCEILNKKRPARGRHCEVKWVATSDHIRKSKEPGLVIDQRSVALINGRESCKGSVSNDESGRTAWMTFLGRVMIFLNEHGI